MLEWIYMPEAWISLMTLTALEIVLGIDNIIFIAILCGKLPAYQRDKARIAGLGLAMITRILLLLSLFWIMKLTTPLFALMGQEISGRDIVLIAGGLFLIAKSTLELHSHTIGEEQEMASSKAGAGFMMVITQIAILDIVFSLDSVITAVGMADHIEIMILAVILAVGVMLLASGAISRFVESNPTIKVLALAFLILIGIALVAEGLEFHIPKGYIYFAMAFSLVVEMINLYSRKKQNG
ncbi:MULTISPECIES: TerC family protein [Campylobacter]|uniref:Membrane protein, TerC family n=1 Tax=Campylobacter porcelli TaxID=1660073 RepID=A0A1X9SUR7_9BACT|nr:MULTISPECIES: TerC family protein [unclassified Campylobacter]MCR8678807.1 TerC family protein [Campylobacter sp. RM19072]MCR8696860.1 TerC family protein [Campylobacter sp. RM19073]MEE3704890.1 TerC family protein [Campylobacter sp. CX2-8023-23]MEE3744168.1 TerC family protein [Campylobacter sp. CX2-4855-23]MEE3776649.1 TerC family protein [Campylobacter sp. CX2-4080-23]